MTRRPIDASVSPAPVRVDHHEDALRDAFAAWASGVAVVTARDDDGRVYGMTVAAFTPVSIDPPLALVCIHDDAPLASVLGPGIRAAVSILGDEQKRAATTFADRFTVGGDLLRDDPLPAVRDAAATLHCRVVRVDDGGDHRIVLLAIEEAVVGPVAAEPLVYWRRSYRRLAPDD